MKFTATLLLPFILNANALFCQFSADILRSNSTEQHTQRTIEVFKPPYIDISEHIRMYGILGPESFTTRVTVQLADSAAIQKYGSKAILMLNDNDVRSLNSIQTLTVFIAEHKLMKTVGCWGQTQTFFDYTILPTLSDSNSQRSILEQTFNFLSDLDSRYPDYLDLTVDCSFGNTILTERERNFYPDPWGNRFLVSQYTGLNVYPHYPIRILNPTARALYGPSIHVIASNNPLFPKNDVVRVRLERVIKPNAITTIPVYWIKEVVPVSESQQSLLK